MRSASHRPSNSASGVPGAPKARPHRDDLHAHIHSGPRGRTHAPTDWTDKRDAVHARDGPHVTPGRKRVTAPAAAGTGHTATARGRPRAASAHSARQEGGSRAGARVSAWDGGQDQPPTAASRPPRHGCGGQRHATCAFPQNTPGFDSAADRSPGESIHRGNRPYSSAREVESWGHRAGAGGDGWGRSKLWGMAGGGGGRQAGQLSGTQDRRQTAHMPLPPGGPLSEGSSALFNELAFYLQS